MKLSVCVWVYWLFVSAQKNISKEASYYSAIEWNFYLSEQCEALIEDEEFGCLYVYFFIIYIYI